MERIWAPWRIEYIVGGERESGCIFCTKPASDEDDKNLMVHRARGAFTMMNKFPYNNGHLMVVPNRHCLDFESLHESETKELFHLLKTATRDLKDTLRPHGFNIGINIGKVGGAGEDHLHIHIIPRWAGDTNFMPILGETKIIPQYLEKTYQILRLGFRNHLAKRSVRKGVNRP